MHISTGKPEIINILRHDFHHIIKHRYSSFLGVYSNLQFTLNLKLNILFGVVLI